MAPPRLSVSWRAVPLLLIGGAIGFYARGFFEFRASRPVAMPSATASAPRAVPATATRGDEAHRRGRRVEDLFAGERLNMDPVERDVDRAVATGEFTADEVQTALRRLDQVPDLRERSTLLGLLLRRWASLDGRAAFSYLEAMADGEMKVHAMTQVARVLARADPQLLVEKTATLPASAVRRELIQELSKTWAARDVRSALVWAESLPEDIGRKDALAIVRSEMATQEPAEAAVQLGPMPKGDERNTVLTVLSENWGARDPRAALAWASQLPDEEKNLARSSLINGWARTDPYQAIGYAATLPPGEAQNQAVMSVVANWANRSPRDAANWVAQFPDSALREQGIHEAIEAWTRVNADEARTWAQTLPAGPARDLALKNFVESVAQWAPEKAGNLGLLIENPATCLDTLQTTLRNWESVDPRGAHRWLGDLGVSEEIKAELRSP